VELDQSLNASKFSGQDLAGLPVGEKKWVGDVPFVFPGTDARGNNHIDLKPSWLRAGFIPDGSGAYSVDTDAARWIGALGPDPARIQFRVANARYLNLHLLAAADGAPNTVPIVTAQFFRSGAGHPVDFPMRVPLFTASSQASHAVPLRLANGQEGQMFLVTIPLEPESLSRFSDTDTVEIELTKQVQLFRTFPDPMYCSSHGAGLPSGVHVFAMTLERPAIDFEFEPDRFAHIWTAPD
jgi:hypothetical protein